MLNIKQRQINLQFLGYYKGQIDGIVGILTKQSYVDFQKDYGLVVDGIYGVKTNAKLIEVIKQEQIKLEVNADGIVGPITLNAKKNQTVNVNLSWRDIKYFKKSEFNCHCGCGLNNIDLKLVKILDEIREYFGKPMLITCGCRCQKYNDSLIGSIKNSKHTQGKASDIWINGINKSVLLSKCKDYVNCGRASYTYTNENNMKYAVHIDI